MAKISDRWLVAELTTNISELTPYGRDLLVEFLRSTADQIGMQKCDSRWSQPKRRYALKVGV